MRNVEDPSTDKVMNQKIRHGPFDAHKCLQADHETAEPMPGWEQQEQPEKQTEKHRQ